MKENLIFAEVNKNLPEHAVLKLAVDSENLAVIRSKRSSCFFFVGDQTQTSLGLDSNDATYDVYLSKAIKTLMY